jgi:cbb3-type cytochrome oxidase maturation protein
MTALAWLIPAALFLGALGLAGFLWSLKSGQFEDLEGAGWRALDDDQNGALPPEAPARTEHASDMTNRRGHGND